MFHRLVSVFIIVTVTSAQTLEPDVTCDYSDSVLLGNAIDITSPNWPNAYKAGVTCRWIIDCPEHYCRLQCQIGGLPESHMCHIDKLLVSPEGSTHFDEAKEFCGRVFFNVTSIATRISMGLVSSPDSPGGRFKCKVSAKRGH